MVRLIVGWLAAWLLVCGIAGGARGDSGSAQLPLSPEAMPHFDAAIKFYNVGQYAEAVEEFRASYKIDPRPEVLYAMAQAMRLNDDCRHAIPAYHAFLRGAPTQKQIDNTQLLIAQCESRVLAQDSAAHTEPAAAPPVPVEVTGKPAARSAVRPWYKDAVGDVLTLGGIAVLATGAGLWGVANHQIDMANDATQYADFDARAKDASSASGLRVGGIVCVIAGVALIGGGVVHYLLRSKSHAARAALFDFAIGDGIAP